jgi:hypothetical protein
LTANHIAKLCARIIVKSNSRQDREDRRHASVLGEHDGGTSQP